MAGTLLLLVVAQRLRMPRPFDLLFIVWARSPAACCLCCGPPRTGETLP
jgi:hypothetical protein